ncbi:transglycosylase SLT domain-containing protein [Paraburkholderia sp. D1E]|uniref:transglycosylase SLT domain-containing protein n=1 Tax=Paraburkholderia sp. D1E TaxID=3461398 RepID=UPI004045AB3B
MPIDDLYADSTSSFLAGSNQVNVPTPQSTPSTSITSIARAVGRGIGQGGASLFGAAADTASGLSQLYVDPDSLAGNPDAVQRADAQVGDAFTKARSGHLFESTAGTNLYDLADTLKPDPTKTTAIDQVVQGAVSGLTQIVPAAVLGGPLAGAVVGGGSMGLSRAEDLKRQGVDVGTRTAIGSIEGALGGAGAVMPLGGSTLLRTAGLVAVGGPGLTIAQGAAEKAILRNANYDHLADQIDPLDPTNLAASTLVAGAFGAVHAVGQIRADRAATAAGAAPTPPVPISSEPLTSMSVADRKALAFNSPSLDAYATQAAQAAGVPPAMLLFIKNKGEQSNSNQVSSAGAKGVMQFTDPTWAAYGKGDPTDPVNSIDASALYAKDLLQRYDGDVRAAITEYNGGVKQAEAVHAGGAPTDPQTIAYLHRYDQFAADHQISNASFTPTPEQVDASLLSTGQHLVDDAHLGPDTDIASMVAHQDAFELAARQMDGGQFPSVADALPPNSLRADALQTFARDANAGTASGSEPAVTSNEPAETAPVTAYTTAKGSDYTVHDDGTTTRNKAARSDVGHEGDSGVKTQSARTVYVDDDASRLSAAGLEGLNEKGARVVIKDGKATLLTWNEKEGKWGASPSSRGIPIHDEPQVGRYPLELWKPTDDIPGYEGYRGMHAGNKIVEVRRAEAVAARARTVPDASGAGLDRPIQSATASDEKRLSPVESNVRDAAQVAPDTPVHLDPSTPDAVEHNGTLASALELIDNEHAATLDDTKLFSVAANCFIGTVTGNA